MFPQEAFPDSSDEEEGENLEDDEGDDQGNWNLEMERGSVEDDDDEELDIDLFSMKDTTPLAGPAVQMRKKGQSVHGSSTKTKYVQ